MKAAAFSAIIATYANVLISLGVDRKIVDELIELSVALATHGDKTVSSVLKAFERQHEKGNDFKQLPTPVVSALGGLAELIELTKPQSEAHARKFYEFVKLFGKGFAAWLGAAPKVNSAKRKPKAPIDFEQARKIADQLQDAVLDPISFDQIVESLRTDRSVSKALLDDVSRRFLGHDVVYRTKKEILERFVERSKIDVLHDGRRRIMDKVRA